jgi:PIN domain nuclease of toxin-antitoxin system
VTDVLLDTHVWAWTLIDSPKLSRTAIERLGKARSVFVSPISFFEIGQKIRLGKWPEMEPFAAQLPKLLHEQGGRIAVLGEEICLFAGTFDWTHRDPFDRVLAATAILSDLPLMSADPVFDGLAGRPSWRERVW